MTLPRLGAPLTVGIAGFALLYLMARFDGAQSARLHELDAQQTTLTTQTLHAAQTHRAVQRLSDATDRENARLRAVLAQREAVVTLLRHRADSLGASVAPVLAALPDSVSHPIVMLLAVKDSIIGEQSGVIHGQALIIDNLGKDRDAWRDQSGRDAALATEWQQQAGRWEKESKRGCIPVLGCIGRSTVALVAGGLGLAGGVLLSR